MDYVLELLRNEVVRLHRSIALSTVEENKDAYKDRLDQVGQAIADIEAAEAQRQMRKEYEG